MAGTVHQSVAPGPIGKSLPIPLPRHAPLDGVRHLVEGSRWSGWRRGGRRGHWKLVGMRLRPVSAARKPGYGFTAAQIFNLPYRRLQVCARGMGNRYRPGFSLIELMVVIVLIGIMAAMIVPEMKGTYEEALLRATSRRLVDVFHLAY